MPGVSAGRRRLRLDQQRPDQQAARGAGPGRSRGQPRIRNPFRRYGDRAIVLGRRHARRRVLPWRPHCARRHQHPHPRRGGVADRPDRHHFRRVRRCGARRLLRPEEARRACRFPRAVPAAQRRGIALDRRQHHQPVARLLRRHQQLDAIPALARRQFVQRRDLRRHEPDAAAARLDQRVRHLQPHAVPVRPRCVRCAVLGLHAVSGVARGRGFGGGAGVLCAGRDRELLRQVPAAAAGVGRARA